MSRLFCPVMINFGRGDKMTIGERITAIIEDSDTSIAELCRATGFNPRQVTRWKTDEAEMGIMKLKEICQYYGVSANYILGLPKGLQWPR